MGKIGSILKAAVVVAALAVLAGCSGGTHSRGQFNGYVVGVGAEDIESKMGKPVSIDAANPDKPRWVYQKKTFDPDNFNQVDEKTIIILEKKNGKLVGVDVLFG
jgi:hypothetical protein